MIIGSKNKKIEMFTNYKMISLNFLIDILHFHLINQKFNLKILHQFINYFIFSFLQITILN